MSKRIKYVSINAGTNGIRLNYTECFNEESKGENESREYADRELYFTGSAGEVSKKLSDALTSLVPGMMKEAGMKEEEEEKTEAVIMPS